MGEKITRKWVVVDLFIQHYQKMEYFMQKNGNHGWYVFCTYVLTDFYFDGFIANRQFRQIKAIYSTTL